MTYAELIESEIAESNYLLVLEPRKRIDDFVLHTGAIYKANVTQYVSSVVIDGLTLTAHTNSSLSSGQYYYDFSQKTLYVRDFADANPNTKWTIVTVEHYFSTIDAHWHRIPTNNNSEVVYFEPLMSKAPVIEEDASSIEEGFIPRQTTTCELINAENYFNEVIKTYSFSNATAKLYHWLSLDLSVSNIKHVGTFICERLYFKNDKVIFTLGERASVLLDEFRHESSVESFYKKSTHSLIDPKSEGCAVRKVFGRVNGVVPVNISYKDENPTTSDNRTWVVCGGQSGLGDLVVTVLSSPVSTTTRTYVASVNGLNIGDTILIDKALDESAIITGVGSNYIDHTAISVPAVGGDLVKRAFVSAVFIEENGTLHRALYGRDYTVTTTLPGGHSGFVFSTNLEINLGMATLKPTDPIFCTVYGPRSLVTLNGPVFGSNDPRTDNSARPAQVLLYLMKRAGVMDSEIDATTWGGALASLRSGISFSTPGIVSARSHDKVNELIANILKSSLSVLRYDGEKFFLRGISPFGAPNLELVEDELIGNSTSFEFDYKKSLRSDITVRFDRREVDFKSISETFRTRTYISDSARYLHLINKTKDVEIYYHFESDADYIAQRMMFISSNVDEEISLRIKNRGYLLKTGDTIDLGRAILPGFSYDGELHNRKYRVVRIEKTINGVTVFAIDQRGIEDNNLLW